MVQSGGYRILRRIVDHSGDFDSRLNKFLLLAINADLLQSIPLIIQVVGADVT